MKVERIASWVLALGLAGALAGMMGFPKLLGSDPNPIFALIAGRSGLGFFEPIVRYATGASEIIAALLLVIPLTRGLGAVLAIGITSGAIAFHLSPWLGIQIPEMDRLVELLKAGTPVTEIDAMGLPTDGGALFMMAVAFLVMAMAIAWLERGRLLGPLRPRST